MRYYTICFTLLFVLTAAADCLGGSMQVHTIIGYVEELNFDERRLVIDKADEDDMPTGELIIMHIPEGLVEGIKGDREIINNPVVVRYRLKDGENILERIDPVICDI